MTETPVGRGRHRRPRPRKVLFAVGGLALAAGALSLVRMAPESGVGGIGTAEADPRQDPGPGAARPGNDAAVPRVSRSAASVLGGVSVTPTAGASVLPLPATTTPPAHSTAAATPGITTVPEAPNAPTATATTRPPATTAPAPRPSPTSGRTTPPPAPAPAPSHTGGHGPRLCVPVVGLCVGALTDKDG
ncbi:hypothetical protein ACIBL8_14230 [Streptomyces sp. NPDC050523]|uniref:hypothetical protein n=1 Tax=Streptomyces sp. NPDC050523 TaxID=3365622 RepID=UPI0037B873EC